MTLRCWLALLLGTELVLAGCGASAPAGLPSSQDPRTMLLKGDDVPDYGVQLTFYGPPLDPRTGAVRVADAYYVRSDQGAAIHAEAAVFPSNANAKGRFDAMVQTYVLFPEVGSTELNGPALGQEAHLYQREPLSGQTAPRYELLWLEGSVICTFSVTTQANGPTPDSWLALARLQETRVKAALGR